MNRMSNFELMRGILMYMIVLLHIVGLGVLNYDNPISRSEGNFIAGNFIESFSICAVNAFVLLTGYWGIKFKLSKLLRFYLPVWFYSVIIALFFFVFEGERFGFTNLFPFTFQRYWFFTSYILLYFVSPVLESFISMLDSSKKWGAVIIFIVILFFLYPSITRMSFSNYDRGFGVINFSCLYLIGRYLRIRFHGKEKSVQKCLLCIFIYCMASIMIFGLTLGEAYYFGNYLGWKSLWYGYDTIFVLIASVSILLLFRNISLHSKQVNFLAPSFFFVYIMHEHPITRQYLWNYFNCPDYYCERPFNFVFHTLIVAFVVFTSGVLIDLLRRLLLGKYMDFLADLFSVVMKKAMFYFSR